MPETFESLTVWKKSHQATMKIYKITKRFPKEELFGLTSQLRRSASSIPTNLAEGRSRKNKNEFKQFVNIALGSCGETIYHLILSRDLGIISPMQFQEFSNDYNEINKMLNGLYTSLK